MTAGIGGYLFGMDQHGSANTPPLIHLDDDVDVAAQLVQRFGYDEAERIMLDALDAAASIDHEARRAEPNATA